MKVADLGAALTGADPRGGRDTFRWPRRMRAYLAVPFDTSPDPFANLNTPDDLALAEARLAGR